MTSRLAAGLRGSVDSTADRPYHLESMRQLSRLWKGELALQNAFWNWAVLGGLAINVASSAAFLSLLSADRLILALVIGYAVPVPYNVVVLVGVWRSAERYSGDRRWADVARIATVVGMLVLSVT